MESRSVESDEELEEPPTSGEVGKEEEPTETPQEGSILEAVVTKSDLTQATGDNSTKARLDKLISDRFGLSRTSAAKHIKNGLVTVNGTIVTKGTFKSKVGDKIKVAVEPKKEAENKPKSEDIPLEVLYEDEDIVVINKSPGITVHGTPGRHSGTLVNALLHRFGTLSTIGGEDRPGIVHRLDKDTSGLMVIARNDVSHKKLKDLFLTRDIVKKYCAIVVGRPKQSVVTSANTTIINKKIARHPKDINKMIVSETEGKDSVTEYSVMKSWSTRKKNEVYAMLDVRIHTGRTHQIRVHMSHSGVTTYLPNESASKMDDAKYLTYTGPC
eukprot:TRINITY_DN9204_c0_g1_i1.p1 TRINITY_DN9204_c0_g1~~TRINITY_DN9204_c0_g1_i1.p1  ORF type:complete len:384 (+),score=46.24 TRINITY_DN9204_c0_g1_i1:172-1152(+)